MRLFACSVFAAVVAAFLLATIPLPCSGTTNMDDIATTYEPCVIGQIDRLVHDKWSKLSKWCAETIELQSGLSNLPDKRWLGKDKRDQYQRINRQIMEIRKLLLTTDSQKIMKDIDRLDERIADVDEEMRKFKELCVIYPEKQAKISKKLDKLQDKRKMLDRERKKAAQTVIRELNALGLHISGDTAEQCIFTVNMGDLIDNTIVAKGVGTIVANLGELMKSGDIAAARRYYGMYVMMVTVQKSCFDEYLEKSRHGEWRRKLARIRDDANTLAQQAEFAMMDESFSYEQRDVYRKNYILNSQTVDAVDAYERVLDAHETIIEQKAEAAAKMLQVAQNSFSTISLAGDFISLVNANQDSFDALIELNLPPLELFDDSSLQTEFLALTKKLKE